MKLNDHKKLSDKLNASPKSTGDKETIASSLVRPFRIHHHMYFKSCINIYSISLP